MAENLYTPNSIRTRSGQYVNVLELDPDTIRIEDIAHALSMVPRFGGHLPVPYSVGQHSLGVLNTVMEWPQPAGTTAEEIRMTRLQALLHDASEAYLGDMPSPIKQHLPDFGALEERIMQVIAKKFGFPWPMLPEVKEADRIMLEAEWKGVMLGDYNPKYLLEQPFVVERFLERFNELSRC
jgi:hypothetical protein